MSTACLAASWIVDESERHGSYPNRMGWAKPPRPGAALGGKELTGVLSFSFRVRLVLLTIQ